MSYFNHFPLVNYGGTLQVNLTRRVAIGDVFKTSPEYFYEYSVKEGDTPESLADQFYDDAELAWIVLDMNGIINVFEEWPKSQYELDEYVKDKYEDPQGIHHYVSLVSGMQVWPGVHPSYDMMPVTNYEYETQLNDDKRTIKLLLPDYVMTVVSRHREMMIKGL